MALFGKKESENKNKTRKFSPGETLVRPMGISPAEIIAERERKKYQQALFDIYRRIHAAINLENILIDLKEDILSLLNAERITIYAYSEKENIIFSKFKDGEEIKDIRVPVNNKSIAGYAANNKKAIAIDDAYNGRELTQIDPELSFNRDFDLASGFRTREVVAVPMLVGTKLMGVLQLLNKKRKGKFTAEDKQAVAGIVEAVGKALLGMQKAQTRQLTKYDYLVHKQVISSKGIKEALSLSKETGASMEQVLMKNFEISKEDIGKSLHAFYMKPFYEFRPGMPILPFDILESLEAVHLRTHLWVPVKVDDSIYVAIDNPRLPQKLDDIKRLIPARSYTWMVALPEDILKTIDYFFGSEEKKDEVEGEMDADFQDILEDEEEEEEDNEFEDIEEVTESDNVVIRLVDKIIKDAHRQGVSDIHIEPSPQKGEKILVRFRIDGTCKEYQSLPSTFKRALSSRIKIMAGLDIANRLKPQDGKIQCKKFGGPDIELRVASIPTIGDNESVVIRLLASSEPIPVDKLGMHQRNIGLFKNVVKMPYGIFLVVGPTGSGKTTTLHSALGYINTPERKIWTAEDPVEITQKGLSQVQVNPKSNYTFAAAMRAFLRADPDVIMIGEMRDYETASMAVEASLTGHLVFSTLHTNSAPETVIRLLDMGIDPFNFADALLGVLAQRLMKRLCLKCKNEKTLTEEEFAVIAEEYGSIEMLKKQGIEYQPELSLYQAKGCNACNEGYKGRMGIHELLEGTDHIKSLIQQKAVAEKVRDAAMEEGMITLKQDGIIKVFAGHADLVQVRAVCIK